MKNLMLLAVAVASMSVFAEECKKEQAQEQVIKACDLIKAKGKDALTELNAMRFCGENYVWIQDKDVKMVQHPTKPRLNGQDVKGNVDENKFPLFVEFDKMARAKKEGGWVDYVWAKPGAEKATPKTSFVKVCEGGLDWIAGSGVWK